MRVEREVTVRNRHGLHARPAAEFVKVASRFAADVRVRREELEVNGKSIMGVLMLAAEPGATLVLSAEGEDAAPAVESLAELLLTDEGELDDPELGGDPAKDPGGKA